MQTGRPAQYSNGCEAAESETWENSESRTGLR